jgi:hypothetical protein
MPTPRTRGLSIPDCRASIPAMTRATWILLGSLLGACASGPHPSLEVASKEFKCPVKDLTRHEIYPNKQRVEGCGKEGIFVKGCDGYGVTAQCGWVKAPPGT